MIPPEQPLPRDAHEWSDAPEFTGTPMFRSRRMAETLPVQGGSNGLDLQRIAGFVVTLGEALGFSPWAQGFFWGGLSVGIGAFITAVIVGPML